MDSFERGKEEKNKNPIDKIKIKNPLDPNEPDSQKIYTSIQHYDPVTDFDII